MSANDPVIEARELSRYYGSFVALEDVHLRVSPGELVAVLGANGAGKSTLLALLAGILQPSRGEIRLLGKSCRRRSKEQRRALGYSGEQPLLYGDLTLEESLGLVLKAGGEGYELERLLADFQLEDFRARPLRECSQGIRRRAGLARAFILKPALYILDEPLANLDRAGQESFLDILRRERGRGAAVIVAAHEDHFLKEPGVRTVTLRGGREVRG